MRARTDRTILLTAFDAICIDREEKTGVCIPMIIAGFYDRQEALIEAVRDKSLLTPRLEMHRAVNIRYMAEYRSMTDQFFQRHATLKDYFYEDERIH